MQEKTLFLSREGGALNHVWLSTQIAQYVKRAEIGKHGGCHLFRHNNGDLDVRRRRGYSLHTSNARSR